MFVGHIALALAGKRASTGTSLGWLVSAGTAADLLWPLFLLGGIERARIEPGATAFTPLVFESYPWSHSLLMLAVWGVVLGALARWRGADSRAMWLIAALVVSHWLLDFLTHAPDMPLWPGPSPKLGMTMWNSIPVTLLVEGGLWTAGIALYLRGRRAKNWSGRLAFWSLVVVSTFMWATSPWSPPPPNVQALGWFALIGWITVPWAIWADRGYERST